jgi:hypothetical protein
MEKVTREKELVVTTGNKAGTLAEITDAVASQGVNIEHFCAYTIGDKAVFCLLTSDNEKAKAALEPKGFQVKEDDVILLRLWNRPGSLAAVAKKMKQGGVDLENVYGTSSKIGERMTFIFSTKDNDKAAELAATMVLDGPDAAG